MGEEKLRNYGSMDADKIGSCSYDSSESFECNFELSHDVERSENSIYSVLANENTSLLDVRSINTRKSSVLTYDRRYSIASITHSISKYTTSNYFGFGSTSYAVAHIKERGFTFSKTVSLADIPSEDRKTPTLVSFFTFFSLITGLSVFAMPLVVARCGWTMVVGIMLAGIGMWYSCHLINECQYQIGQNGERKRIYENYIDLGKASIKWHGESVMKILVGSSLLSDIYALIFCSQISRDLSRDHFQLDDHLWMLIWISVAFPLFFIRKMSVLAWLGFLSLIFYVVGLVMIFGLLIWNYNSWDFSNLNFKSSFNISYMFIGYGIFINSFNIHLSAPAIEACMKYPQQFKKINATGFALNTVLKVVISVTAAATFGLATNGSMLTNMKIYGTVTTTINILIAAYMITQYPTSLFVVFEMLDFYIMPKFPLFKKDHKSEWVWLFLSRFLVTLIITFVAVSIPNFEMMTGFIGNIRGTCATLVFPIFFYLKLHKRRISTLSYVFHCLVIFIVVCFGLTGASFSILGMLGYNDIII